MQYCISILNKLYWHYQVQEEINKSISFCWTNLSLYLSIFLSLGKIAVLWVSVKQAPSTSPCTSLFFFNMWSERPPVATWGKFKCTTSFVRAAWTQLWPLWVTDSPYLNSISLFMAKISNFYLTALSSLCSWCHFTCCVPYMYLLIISVLLGHYAIIAMWNTNYHPTLQFTVLVSQHATVFICSALKYKYLLWKISTGFRISR